MARGLPISTFVDISVSIAAGGVLRTQFGTGLMVTEDATLPAGGSGKAKVYRDIEGVQADFDAAGVLGPATVWFSADPPPKSLYIGRWARQDVVTTLVGGTPGALSTLAAANSSFSINGQVVTVDLSGAATYAAKAAALQVAIRLKAGIFASATVTHTNNVFVLTLTSEDAIGFAGKASTGTDISTALGWTSAAGAESKTGHDAERVDSAAAEMIALAAGTAPVALMLADDVHLTYTSGGGSRDTRDDLAAFAQAGDYVFGQLETDNAALVTGDTTSKAALAFQRQQSHVETVYSMAGERPDIGLLALLSAQNLNLPASIITPHLKALPGVQPTIITETQRLELQRKRTNVYTTVGGLPALAGGYTGKAGSWLDAIWWLLWLKNEMELNIYNAQRAARRFNTAILRDTLTQVMRVAVQSGGTRPGGKVNASVKQDIIETTGNNEFDGILPAGWTMWVEQPNVRSDLDRENRIGRFKMWIAPADAIHEVLGSVVLSG